MNHKLVQVKDAMTINNYQFADGMMTVADGIKLAKQHNIGTEMELIPELDDVKNLFSLL